MSDSARYAAPQRLLHWTTAALIAVVATLGVWLAYFRPEEEGFKLRLYNLHESLGVVIWLLTLVRVVYRRRHPPPPLPAETEPFVRFAAHAAHIGLYGLLILLPLIGLLATNAWGFQLEVFGVLPLPAVLGKDEALAKILSTLHWCGALAGAFLLAGHMGGVVYHTFVRKDGLLRRML
jgi:cytochrome b561